MSKLSLKPTKAQSGAAIGRFPFGTRLPQRWVLLARGHDVDFVWLPATRHQRACTPEPMYDYWDEELLTDEPARLGADGLPDGLRLLDLRAFPLAPDRRDMENECRRLAWIDARNLRRSTQVADEDAHGHSSSPAIAWIWMPCAGWRHSI